jgi:hypothetical protein
MASSKEDRVRLTYDAYSRAYQRRKGDLKAAKTETEVQKILSNVAKLESLYLTAAQDGLDGTAPAIDIAYQAAVDARDAVEDAYNGAKALAEKIRLVGASPQSLADSSRLPLGQETSLGASASASLEF